MFNSNNYVAIIFASVVSIAFVLTFFALQNLGDSNTVEELEVKMRTWNKNKPYSFSYTITKGCMFVNVVEVTNINDDISYKSNRSYHKKVNIDDLFNEIRRALNNAYSIQVVYSQQGFPERIEIDWSKSVIDDECFSEVSNFRII